MEPRSAFGEFLKKKRLALRLSLRAFCVKHGEDPSNWSKMERGILSPPSSSARLADIARKIGVADDLSEEQELFDLASAAQGRIPEDLMERADLVAQLPAVFRTIRGDVPSEADLMTLADLVKEAITPRNEQAK